jgi:cobalt-zinc-cadmium efflux system membrane fusion protein
MRARAAPACTGGGVLSGRRAGHSVIGLSGFLRPVLSCAPGTKELAVLRYSFYALIVVAAVFVGAYYGSTSPPVSGHDAAAHAADQHAGEDQDQHAGEDVVVGAHDEPGHADEGEAEHLDVHDETDEQFTLSLSPQARSNLRLSVVEVARQPFEKTVAIPAMVVERPGLARIEISAPLTGVVTNVFRTKGETVTPGQPLFTLRLTHEELVELQREFLGTLEQIDVVRREVDRLKNVTQSGAVAGKTYLERQYELQKLEAALRTFREALVLHGLTGDQVDQIVSSRTLFKEMVVAVPAVNRASAGVGEQSLLQLKDLSAYVGQHVEVGQQLCLLSDYRELYVEGQAFEKDAPQLERAAENGWTMRIVCDVAGSETQRMEDLRLLFVSGEVDPESRALRFYAELPNQIKRDTTGRDGRRFVTWRFRPGQRCRLLVPVERWDDQIVLPVDAVVDDGAESYVFVEHDGHFDRRRAEVKYRDQSSVVLGPASELAIGDRVAASGAHQMNLAIKNKLGGGIDPHAGHQH